MIKKVSHFKLLNKQLKKRLREKNTLIQVLIGPRQVGKTTFIESFIKEAGQNRYLFVSGDGIQSSVWIEEKWEEAKDQNKTLIIDEIQKIPDWSEVVKKCWDHQRQKKNRIKCILLGSSSLSLNKGLSESLTGRFELIQFYHWNWKNSQELSKFSLDQYLIYGGYPGSYHFCRDSKRWHEYLRSSIVETVISKDILLLAQVKSPALFRQCFYLLINTPAQVVSYNKILGQLQDKGNIDMVKYYIDLFQGAYLIKAIHKYKKNEVRKHLSSPKIITMAPALNTFHRLDQLTPEYMGRIFESLVGAQLVKNKDNVFYWSEGDYEVDFVIEHKGETIAIEVKSGRNKKSKSLEIFQKKYPQTKLVFITKDNYLKFEKDPIGFIEDKID